MRAAALQRGAGAPCCQQIRASAAWVVLPQKLRGRRSRRALSVCAFSEQRALPAQRGASGLDISDGKQMLRPTSPAAWLLVRSQLQELGVKLISQQELLFAQEAGVPVIDIRPPPEWEAGHIEGSVNVPLYRLITGWDARKFLRRAGFAFFGVLNGTELNPAFHEEVAAAADKDKGAVLLCNMGGTMDDSKTKAGGMQSRTGEGKEVRRSLMAAYELTNLGFKSGVRVLKGGFNEWRKSGRKVAVVESDVSEEGEHE